MHLFDLFHMVVLWGGKNTQFGCKIGLDWSPLESILCFEFQDNIIDS